MSAELSYFMMFTFSRSKKLNRDVSKAYGEGTHCRIPGIQQEARRSGAQCESFESRMSAASSECFYKADLSASAHMTWKQTRTLTTRVKE